MHHTTLSKFQRDLDMALTAKIDSNLRFSHYALTFDLSCHVEVTP
jgi:hypothetical protein